MNPRERIRALLAGDPIDRPPYGLVCGSLGGTLISESVSDLYRDPDLYARGQEAVCGILDPDIVFGPFVLSYEAAAFGAQLAAQRDSAPNVRKPPFRSIADLRAAEIPDIPSDRFLSYLVDSVKALRKRLGETRLIAVPVTSPTDLPAMLIGMEAWIETLLFRPEEAEGTVSVCIQHLRALSEAYRAAGADVLVIPLMFGNPRILDENSIRRLILPLLRRTLEAGRLPVVIHHGGNPLARQIGLFAGLPNLMGFVLGPRDGFGEARERAGRETILLGNLLGPCFDAYTPKDLARAVSGLREDRKDDRRWIFSNSGAELPAWTPPDRLALVRDLMQGRPM